MIQILEDGSYTYYSNQSLYVCMCVCVCIGNSALELLILNYFKLQY